MKSFVSQENLTILINQIVKAYGDKEDSYMLLKLKNSHYRLKSDVVNKLKYHFYEKIGPSYTKKDIINLLSKEGSLSFLVEMKLSHI